MKIFSSPVGKDPRKIVIRKPTIESPEEEALWDEVRKFAKMIPFEPEPNMGRVQEIREEIKKGTYLTPEILDETAVRMAVRFMRKE